MYSNIPPAAFSNQLAILARQQTQKIERIACLTDEQRIAKAKENTPNYARHYENPEIKTGYTLLCDQLSQFKRTDAFNLSLLKLAHNHNFGAKYGTLKQHQFFVYQQFNGLLETSTNTAILAQQPISPLFLAAMHFFPLVHDLGKGHESILKDLKTHNFTVAEKVDDEQHSATLTLMNHCMQSPNVLRDFLKGQLQDLLSAHCANYQNPSMLATVKKQLAYLNALENNSKALYGVVDIWQAVLSCDGIGLAFAQHKSVYSEEKNADGRNKEINRATPEVAALNLVIIYHKVNQILKMQGQSISSETFFQTMALFWLADCSYYDRIRLELFEQDPLKANKYKQNLPRLPELKPIKKEKLDNLAKLFENQVKQLADKSVHLANINHCLLDEGVVSVVLAKKFIKDNGELFITLTQKNQTPTVVFDLDGTLFKPNSYFKLHQIPKLGVEIPTSYAEPLVNCFKEVGFFNIVFLTARRLESGSPIYNLLKSEIARLFAFNEDSVNLLTRTQADMVIQNSTNVDFKLTKFIELLQQGKPIVAKIGDNLVDVGVMGEVHLPNFPSFKALTLLMHDGLQIDSQNDAASIQANLKKPPTQVFNYRQ